MHVLAVGVSGRQQARPRTGRRRGNRAGYQRQPGVESDLQRHCSMRDGMHAARALAAAAGAAAGAASLAADPKLRPSALPSAR